MPELPLFALARDKIGRARSELLRLETYLHAYEGSGLDDVWSRSATIAFAVHGAYTGLEDVMADIAAVIDGHVPKGATSHQALLDQMHVAIEGRRPALLDDSLYARLVELKAFRHLVRHQYGIDLDPEKTDAKRHVMADVLVDFEASVTRLANALGASG